MNTQVATQAEQSPQEALREQFDRMDGEIEKVLPEHVSRDKFIRVVLTAVGRDPDLMAADRRSLMAACLDAAQDGLIPDGRDAALVVFSTKVKVPGEKDIWVKKVQYMPMIAGIYKKVRNSGDISTLSAHIVYTNDAFEYWVDEDGAHLRHTPQLIGERGRVLLVYAVCKLKDGSVEIETMTKSEIEEVRAISKSGSKGPWGSWWGEMARKTVVRRLSKRLPMSSDLERLMRRDDSMYDLDPEQKPAVDAPPRPQRVAYQPTPPPQGEDLDDQYRATMEDHEPESASGGPNGAQMDPGEEASGGEPTAAELAQGRAALGEGHEFDETERKAADSAGQPNDPPMSERLTNLKAALAKQESPDALEGMLAEPILIKTVAGLDDPEAKAWREMLGIHRKTLDSAP